MPNMVVHRTLQEYGTGDTVALALTQYSGMVLAAYEKFLVFARHVMSMPITNGRSKQFPAIARAEAENLVPGVDRVGSNQPQNEERLITLDDYQLISDEFLDEADDFVNHISSRQTYANQHGLACADQVDQRLSRMISIGARVADAGSGADLFIGGHVITAADAGAITAAYPATLTGSIKLQTVFAEMAQEFDERHISDANRVAFLSPYLTRVLLCDKTLLSRDYQGVNDLISRRMVECEGFVIEKTNNLPSADDSANTALPSQYRADFSKVAAQFIGDAEAVGQLTAMGGVRAIAPAWQDTKHGWYTGAKVWQGSKWLRKEACGELVLQ